MNEEAGHAAIVGTDALADQTYQCDLGNGLLLRWSTPEDAEQLVAMFSHIFRSTEDAPPDRFHGCLVRDMMSGRHPYLTSFDFALVEDTTTAQIVAATCLFANTVTYERIPLTLGRAAIVGTVDAYRHRGLQRAIFGLIHGRSAQRGHLLQGITGINYFYRQFGYEHAIDVEATRHVYVGALPTGNATVSRALALRPATELDIPLLVKLAAHERACWQLATVLDERAWRWMLFTPERALALLWRLSNPSHAHQRSGHWCMAIPTYRPPLVKTELAKVVLGTSGMVYMIITAERATIGYLLLGRKPDGGFAGDSLGIWGMAVIPDISLVDIALPALCALRDLVDTFPSRPVSTSQLVRFRLEMGPGHALFEALGPDLAPLTGNGYAWWMRIPDVPALIRHIAPVLEQRLANSLLANYTGECAIDLYRGGLRMLFEHGKLVLVEDWQKPLWGPEQTRFPRLVFTQLLLGYRSYEDLRYAFKDAWADRVDQVLLSTLFPLRPSYMLLSAPSIVYAAAVLAGQ